MVDHFCRNCHSILAHVVYQNVFELSSGHHLLLGSGFTTGFSVLLVPVACETLFGTSTNCTNQAVCSSTGGFDVGLLETTTTWNSDSCYAFCYNNATCACYKFDAGTRECTAFSSSECSLSTTATRSATSCNMLSPDVFDATGE